MNASAAGKSPIREEALPSLLWWSGAGCDIEIDSQVLARLDSEGTAAHLLCGFSESNGEGGDFHVWECVRLPIESLEQFSIAALREFVISRENSMAMAPVGLWIPASWWPEHAGTPPGMTGGAEFLPDHPLLVRIDENKTAQVGVWHQSSAEVEELPLRFPASYPALAQASHVPFQILNIRRGSQTDYEPDRKTVAPAPAPNPAVAKPDPKASAPVLRLEVPNWVWICGLVMFAGLLGTAVWYVTQRGSAVSTQPPAALAQPKLNLEVKQGEGGFDVRWDGNAVAALGAQSGVLHILDGAKRTEIALGYVALNSGKVLYIPQSSDIELLLTVYAPAGISQETVRVIRGSSPEQLTVASRARSVTPTAPAVQSQAPPAPSKPARTMQQPADSTTSQPAPASEPPKMADASDAPAVNAAPAGRDPKLEQVAALTPQSLPASPPPAQSSSPQTSAPKPQAAVPPATQPITQAPATQRPSAAAPLSQSAAPAVRVPVIVPPKPSKQVTPVVPAHLRQLLPASAVVEVQVSVGADGSVTAAQAAPGYGVMVHLSRLAREAALKWKFEPATIDGKPVPGQHVLRFKFGR